MTTMTEPPVEAMDAPEVVDAAQYAHAELTVELDEMAFAAGDGPSTFSGVLMRGAKVVPGWGGDLLVRPEMFAAENGKVVPLDVNHSRFPAAGYFTVEAGSRVIRASAGSFLDTAFGQETAAQMKALTDAGVKLEMSMDVAFDTSTERRTGKREGGDYTFERAAVLAASIVLRGAMNGTSFKMSADWKPSRDYRAEGAALPNGSDAAAPDEGVYTEEADTANAEATDGVQWNDAEAAIVASVAQMGVLS